MTRASKSLTSREPERGSRSLERDARGLRELLEAHHDDAWGWTLGCCHWDRDGAADVLQDVYLRVLDGRARFEERSAFRTWLFGVIRHVALEHRRRRERHTARAAELSIQPDEQLAAGGERPDEAAARTERAVLLQDALMRLPERQREVLHLVFYQGLSISEAAGVLAIGVGTARTHYERGKKALRKELGDLWTT